MITEKGGEWGGQGKGKGKKKGKKIGRRLMIYGGRIGKERKERRKDGR